MAVVIPLPQSAIADAQTIATGLRPSSLDELGRVPTVDWFCREFDCLQPSITVAQEARSGNRTCLRR